MSTAGAGTPGELATLRRWLADLRAAVERKTADLDAEQLARRSVPPSTLSLLGLVRHLAQMEHHWFHRVLQRHPEDDQLFSLQSKFIVRMNRGGEREQVLALNFSPDPLPFLRPSTSSTILTGRPLGARKHKQNIEPLGERTASYEVDGSALASAKGPLDVNVKLIAGMVPVNLVAEIQEVGFDYGMSPKEIAEGVVAGHRVLWEKDVEVTLE